MEFIRKRLNTKSDSQIRSYSDLRKAVGWIGICLPAVLAIGGMLTQTNAGDNILEDSISHYYHTPMGDVFVGAMCAVALFMFFYQGPTEADNILGNIAGVCALGVAWFRTTPYEIMEVHNNTVDAIGIVHFIFAVSFFICLTIFSLFLFPMANKLENQSDAVKSLKRKIFYTCGAIMIFCLVTLFIYMNWFDDGSHNPAVFWGETVALVAFGVSWLTYGRVTPPAEIQA